MDATTYELRAILGGERRFLIPTFQRDYEWNEREQWSLLFDDLLSTASRLQSARAQAALMGDSLAKAEKRVAPHFLGAVVLDQLPSKAGDIDQRAVIDGQQRLTTFQLLLRALADVLAENASARDAQIKRLLFNPVDNPTAPPEIRYKLWPRRKDREVWQLAMGDDPNAAPVTHLYGGARRYFADRTRAAIATESVTEASDVRDHLIEDADVPLDVGKIDLDTLVDAILGLFKVVVIDLDDSDDAQVIFEVLNGRQTPLSAADLVKNLLFLRAEINDEAELEALHEVYWAPLETDWWKQAVGRGHATRQRRELLLAAWLSAQTETEANVGHLYGEIRSYVIDRGRKVHDVLHEIQAFAQAYERIAEADTTVSGRRLAEAYRTLNRLSITTAQPLLLWLETRPDEQLVQIDRQAAAVAMESWVVRRLIAKRNTRGYGAAFLSVLSATARAAKSGASSQEIRNAVVLGLASQKLDWPTDDEIRAAFSYESFYDYHSQERIRLILGAIDRAMAAERPKAEPLLIDYDRLQIEHLLPQGWRQEPGWSVGGDELAEERRDLARHRIGNLTLLTEVLNPSLSNGPWLKKQPEIAKHSKLHLNTQFIDQLTWDEEAIEQRGRELAEYAIGIWPGPEHFGVSRPPE